MIKKYDWEVDHSSSVELSVSILESYIPTLMIKEIVEAGRRLGVEAVMISYTNLSEYDYVYSVFQNYGEVSDLIDFYNHEYDISVFLIIK